MTIKIAFLVLASYGAMHGAAEAANPQENKARSITDKAVILTSLIKTTCCFLQSFARHPDFCVYYDSVERRLCHDPRDLNSNNVSCQVTFTQNLYDGFNTTEPYTMCTLRTFFDYLGLAEITSKRVAHLGILTPNGLQNPIKPVFGYPTYVYEDKSTAFCSIKQGPEVAIYFSAESTQPFALKQPTNLFAHSPVAVLLEHANHCLSDQTKVTVGNFVLTREQTGAITITQQ